MKERISITEYANQITRLLPKGILLNTNGDKFNSMVIGWGHVGTLWSLPTFHVYVRQGRYTKGQLDKTGEFTISVPLEKPDPVITKICGSHSGHNIDKVREAGLTLEAAESNHTWYPGISAHDRVQDPLCAGSGTGKDTGGDPGEDVSAGRPWNKSDGES